MPPGKFGEGGLDMPAGKFGKGGRGGGGGGHASWKICPEI